MSEQETYIGRVQAATTSAVTVVVDSSQDLVKTYEGTPYRVCQVGGYVKFPQGCVQVVGVISEAVQRDVTRSGGDGEIVTTEVRRELKVQLVGSIRDGQFERGVVMTPCVDDEVHIAVRSDMESIFRCAAESPVEVGHLSGMPDLAAFMDGDIAFSHHVALVGGTGCGKSSVVASLVQKAATLPSTQVVVLDLHNEYREAFGDSALVVSGNSLVLPYWLLNFEEMQDLFVDVREQTAHNQVMQLKEQVINAKKESNPDVDRLSVDSPVFFHLERVRDGFQQLDTQMVVGESGRNKQGPFYGQFTRLLARLESRLADVRYDFMFLEGKYTSSETLRDYLHGELGYGDAEKKVTVVDLSGVPSEILGVVVSVLCRVVFDFQFWLEKPTSRPVVLVLEEAHNYVPRTALGRAHAARASVERIAKEGRKYGLGLMLVSQRPSEISETVLAQCGTFVAMRLTNPSDQGYVRALVPDTLGEMMGALPALERGEAIVSGDGVTLPVRVRMSPPNPFPRSEDAKFWTEWSGEKPNLETELVVRRWQQQGR